MILAGRSPDRPTRGDLLADLAAWAADYYPARAAPPPEALATAQLSAADLFLVFASTASIEAHLALVDQEPIRAAIDRARETAEWPALETLIKTRYAQDQRGKRCRTGGVGCTAAPSTGPRTLEGLQRIVKARTCMVPTVPICGNCAG